MTVILDYGAGNLRSVERAVAHLGFSCSVQRDLEGATKAILPGVGAFGAAMESLAPLVGSIREFAAEGKPLLGVCLGQQLLFDESEEFGRREGLGLITGRVRYLPKAPDLKVPHTGWNSMRFDAGDPMFRGVPQDGQVYFVHSLFTECGNPEDVAAWTSYGIEFASAVRRENVWGMQFHPEKSGEVGLRLLRNFLEW